MKIQEISESDYNKLNVPTVFENKLEDRMFGIVTNGKVKYKLGWQSTSIKPTLTIINDALCSIGIDLNFVIIDFDNRETLVKLSLDYFFYDVKLNGEFLYVITELEIIKINIINFTVIETFDLPDYYESMEFKEGYLIVKCIDGEIVTIG